MIACDPATHGALLIPIILGSDKMLQFLFSFLFTMLVW